MPLNLNEKLRRVLSFLVAVRSPRIFHIMGTRGFTQTDLNEGWELFTIAAGAKLAYSSSDAAVMPPDKANLMIAELDRWENNWFPVISATLQRHYPTIHETVFMNLTQTDGPEVLVSVSTMLQRLEEMARTETGKKANDLLVRRGLTEDARKDVFEMIHSLKQSEQAALPDYEPNSLENQKKALVDVWSWYMEWSQITRTLISRGDVLIRMGLRDIDRDKPGEITPEV